MQQSFCNMAYHDMNCQCIVQICAEENKCACPFNPTTEEENAIQEGE